MADFKSWRAYWTFQNHVRSQFRYILEDESKEFLDTFAEKFADCSFTLTTKDLLFRAQLGCNWRKMYQQDVYIDDEPVPYSAARMKPLPYKARQGRANPAGIPYLYLSNIDDTAMSEVRPWLGATLTLAMFNLNRDVKLVNLSAKNVPSTTIYLEEPSATERNDYVMSDINRAFSAPVTSSDETADYIPTQILAERIKKEDFDGIAYKSAFGEDGYNIVLFDINAADVKAVHLFKTNKLNFDFSETGTLHCCEPTRS